jgi:pyruvate formate lyase activating enzyme
MAIQNKPLSGRLFDIQRFSLDDGPGIRTVVFFKGCNMSCSWCHNPESICFEPELFRTYSKCIGCGTCVEVCPQNASAFLGETIITDYRKCIMCGTCIEECPTFCIKKTGYDMDVDTLIEIIIKDKAYYDQSGGGVTFSGGEPTLQYEFLMNSMKKCKEHGITTTLDTNGTIAVDKMEKILPFTDHVLLDIKHINNDKHKEFTGKDNKNILENMEYLARSADVEVRVPVIPTFNDSVEELTEIINRVKESGLNEIRLLPYHVYGMGKYKSLGRECRLQVTENLGETTVKKLVSEIDTDKIKLIIDNR